MAPGSKHGRGAEQVSLRLPDGLRDRVRAYAEQHGRSMNAEIVRILEREFPEPVSLDKRVQDLLDLTALLRNEVSDDRIDELSLSLLGTIQEIADGRATGIAEDARKAISNRYQAWLDDQAETNYQNFESELDDEEVASLRRTGSTAKFVDLDDVDKPK